MREPRREQGDRAREQQHAGHRHAQAAALQAPAEARAGPGQRHHHRQGAEAERGHGHRAMRGARLQPGRGEQGGAEPARHPAPQHAEREALSGVVRGQQPALQRPQREPQAMAGAAEETRHAAPAIEQAQSGDD
jgi:hypothetical protein